MNSRSSDEGMNLEANSSSNAACQADGIRLTTIDN